MKLETSKGKVYDIELISAMNGGKVLIALYDARAMSEIAAEFEGCETMVKTNERQPDVTETYAGYTRLISMQRNAPQDMVRMILAK